MSDHTATTEDVAAAICNGNTEHLRKWLLVAESAFCGECYAVATRLAERGLLATTHPDTTEVAAHALEAAASAAVTDDDGIPWDDDHDRATVSAWLTERADDLREGAGQ